MKTSVKESVSFVGGILVAVAILSLVFVGCGRIKGEDDSQNSVQLGNEDEVQQRDLMIGMSSADVWALYQRYYELMPNDVTKELATQDEFDETSQFYTTLFQLSQHLEPNGVVGESTRKALQNPITPTKEELAQLKALILIDEDEENTPESEEEMGEILVMLNHQPQKARLHI